MARSASQWPLRKVRNGGIAGVLVGIGIFAARQFGVHIPDEVGNGLIAVLAFAVSYFSKPGSREVVEDN